MSTHLARAAEYDALFRRAESRAQGPAQVGAHCAEAREHRGAGGRRGACAETAASRLRRRRDPSPRAQSPRHPAMVIRSAAAERTPLRGAIRVVVVLAEFSDNVLAATSTLPRPVLLDGSYRRAASRSTPRSPRPGRHRRRRGRAVPAAHTLAWYGNGNFGIGQPTGPPARESWRWTRSPPATRRRLHTVRQRRKRFRRRIRHRARRRRRRTTGNGRHLVAQMDAAHRLDRRHHKGIRVSHHSGGRADRRVRP